LKNFVRQLAKGGRKMDRACEKKKGGLRTTQNGRKIRQTQRVALKRERKVGRRRHVVSNGVKKGKRED